MVSYTAGSYHGSNTILRRFFTMTKDKTTTDAIVIAQFKFALIAPVLQGLFPAPSRTAYYKRVTGKPLTLPDGTVKEYGYKTLKKWVSQFL